MGNIQFFPTKTNQLNQNEGCLHYLVYRKTHSVSWHLRSDPVGNAVGQGRRKKNQHTGKVQGNARSRRPLGQGVRAPRGVALALALAWELHQAWPVSSISFCIINISWTERAKQPSRPMKWKVVTYHLTVKVTWKTRGCRYIGEGNKGKTNQTWETNQMPGTVMGPEFQPWPASTGVPFPSWQRPRQSQHFFTL